MPSNAPTLNKMAISAPQPGSRQQAPAWYPEQEQETSAPLVVFTERERVAAAVEFGAALEDLIAYARLRQEESDAVPEESGPPFPPDLLIHREPEDLLRNTCRKLLKLEPALLGLGRSDDTIPSPGSSNSNGLPASNGHSVPASFPNLAEPSTLERTSAPEWPTSPDESSSERSSLNGTLSLERASIDQPNSARPSPGLAASSGTSIPATLPVPPRPQALPRLATPGGPSRELKIREKVDAVLEASAQGEGGSWDLEHRLCDLDKAIWEWNEDIVEGIVDSPAVLSAYRVGKALSLTRWRICVAKHWNQVNSDLSIDPWEKAFCKQRVDEIQRHVNTLSTVLDPQAVTAVATGLGYWRNALLSLTPTEGALNARPQQSWWRDALLNLASIREGWNASPRPAQPLSPQTIKVAPEHDERLLKALEEQIDNWLDLLTGCRPPDSFPVPGIVATLTKKMAADLWSRVYRFLVPAVPFVVIIGALLVAGVLVFNTVATDGWRIGLSQLDLTKVLGSVGTALGGVLTFLIAQGHSLFNRRSGIANGASLGRVGNEESRTSTGSPSSHGTGGSSVVVTGLKQEVLSGIVEQIRLEELNLAVSEPLMRCVLALNNRESKNGDPLKDAERFLRLIHRDKSNLDRLRPVFKDLYKQ